eukprot:TRINITY_DN3796_c0_g2_i1.p1 TRINITY_DN3796_c0_g2~~TRINITY_DN3796_c0_g2_i1.p1  ORF type:complete len:433 (+),score=123.17 TRINITY_DN3796_c0_g2_i1:67-1365(+)
MEEACVVNLNGSTDEFVAEAKLVKLVGSWVEVEEAALLRDGAVSSVVVMMSTAVAVLVVAAYLRNTMLSRGEKAIMYSLQWVFPLSSSAPFIGQKINLNRPSTPLCIEPACDEGTDDDDDVHETAVNKKKARRKVLKVKSLVAKRAAKALKKKKVVVSPVVSETVEDDVVSEVEPEVEDVVGDGEVDVCPARGCARRSQSAPSVVFAEPLAVHEELLDSPVVQELRPATTSPTVTTPRIPTPKEEVRMVKLVLGQEPWEVEVDVRENDLNLSAPTVSFLRCKGFITWCRDDIKGDCQWGHRCRYAHVASDDLRGYLLTILPPIPPQMCPQDFHCNQLNDIYHQMQYRHTCRIPNCPNSQEVWHAIPFHHPPALPKMMPVGCYSYGAPFDICLNTFDSPVIEPVERYQPPAPPQADQCSAMIYPQPDYGYPEY